MSPLFTYLLEVNIVLAVLVALYYVFFRKVKFLSLNRIILLVILVLSFSVPLCPAITYESGFTHAQEEKMVPGNYDGKDGIHFFPSGMNRPEGNANSIYRGLLCVYVLVSLFLLIKLIVQVAGIKRIISNSDKIQEEGLVYCRTENYAAPFSFFNYIILPENKDAVLREIVIHERAHARQWHSIDVLLSEFLCVLLWINPLVYLYRKLVKVNLEFLADEAVLRSGTDVPTYQLSLLQYVLKASGNTMVSTFYSSTIKSRIRMMNTDKPFAHEKVSYYLMVPVMVGLYLLVNPPKPVPMEKAIREKLSTRFPAYSQNDHKEKDIKTVAVSRKDNKQRRTPKQSNAFVKEAIQQTIVENTSSALRLHIDARSDTVRVSLRPLEQPVTQPYEGLYLIGDKVYSDPELRKAVEQVGQLEIILSTRPRIAYYSPGSTDAIQRWGSKAEKGIVLVEPINNL